MFLNMPLGPLRNDNVWGGQLSFRVISFNVLSYFCLCVSLYIFVSQIVCVDAKCTRFVHCVVSPAVITSDILNLRPS